MKKLMMIATLLVASVSAYAQNDDLKNEIGVFYGFESASSYSSIISGAFVSETRKIFFNTLLNNN